MFLARKIYVTPLIQVLTVSSLGFFLLKSILCYNELLNL